MAHYLPPAIMRFFQPRPDLEPKPALQMKPARAQSGVAQFIHRFKDEVPEPVVNETPGEIKAKRKRKRDEEASAKLQEAISAWDPNAAQGEQMTTDGYKTLFVGRLSYEVTEEDLKQEFEYYGNVVKTSLVKVPLPFPPPLFPFVLPSPYLRYR